MLPPTLPVTQIVRTAEDVETTQVSAAYNLGKMVKESGNPRSTILGIMDGMQTLTPAAQGEFRRDWLRGWTEAKVAFSSVQCNYPQAVSIMSNEQLAEECATMRKQWYVALRPGTNEYQWQRALATEEKRRSNAHEAYLDLERAIEKRNATPVLV